LKTLSSPSRFQYYNNIHLVYTWKQLYEINLPKIYQNTRGDVANIEDAKKPKNINKTMKAKQTLQNSDYSENKKVFLKNNTDFKPVNKT
jgi:hypothetical protein